MLSANTPYTIRLFDSPSNRSVVQIFNEDQTEMLTMFMGVRAERMEPADETVFVFIETEPGYALPIREWYYPGRLSGLEFVYPKDQALRIAQHAKEPILATGSADLHSLASLKVESIGPLNTDLPAATATATASVEPAPAPVFEQDEAPAEVAAAEPEAEFEAEAPAELAAAEPVEEPVEFEQEEVQIAQAEAPAEVEQDRDAISEESEGELPRTAGELPLVGLIGLLCLGAGLGLRVLKANN
jgi:hypothetical protein